MAEYRQFEHVLRIEDTKMDVTDFLNGEIYIFSKLDGTQSSIWSDGEEIHCGSRKREISIEKDNADFMLFATVDDSMIKLRDFLLKNPHLIVYGEYLNGYAGRKQAGTIKQYIDPLFWIFGVYDTNKHEYLNYDVYYEMLKDIYPKIDKPLAKFICPKKEDIIELLKDNHFNLPEDVIGEGVVCWRYGYKNKFGRNVIGKIVCDEYYANKGTRPKRKNELVREGLEHDIVESFVTDADCAKCQQKVMTRFNMEDWEINNRTMGAYLNMLFNDLVTEEMWSIIKVFRNPVIDFSILKSETFIKGRKYLGLV